jgi:hypothetical protein
VYVCLCTYVYVCVCMCVCMCVYVLYVGVCVYDAQTRDGVCVHSIPAKAPTTTGAILPAAVSTEKNPCAVPIKKQEAEKRKEK